MIKQNINKVPYLDSESRFYLPWAGPTQEQIKWSPYKKTKTKPNSLYDRNYSYITYRKHTWKKKKT